MKNYFFYTLIVALVLFSGCVTKTLPNYKNVTIDTNATKDGDFELSKRFMTYWHARIQKDFKTSYKMELPYIQYEKNFDQYESEVRTRLKGYKIKLLKIEYDIDTPDIAYVTRQYIRKDVVLKLTSKWIKLNRIWYRKYDLKLLP